MGTGRTRRLRMCGLGLAFCVALMSGCSTPRITMKLASDEWQGAGTAEGGHAFVRNGQTVEDWSELVVLSRHYRPFFAVVFGASSPGRWLAEYRKEHPEGTISMIQEAPHGILFEGIRKGNAGKPDAKYVGRLLDRNASRFVLRYFTSAPKEMTPSLRAQWIDWLLEARIE